MKMYLYGALITAGVAFVLLILRAALRKRILVGLADILYKDNNPEQFLAILSRKGVKLVVSQNTIQLMKLYGYLSLGDNELTIDMFNKLDGKKLKTRNRIDFLQKRLIFYVSTKDADMAEDSYQKLQAAIGKSDDKQLQSILHESKQLLDVYIYPDKSLIKSLMKQEDEQSDKFPKGMTQYRIAKLCHFSGDSVMCKKYLKLAAENLRGTAWEAVIGKAQEDSSVLDVN